MGGVITVMAYATTMTWGGLAPWLLEYSAELADGEVAMNE
jgi:hypothetical protein